MKRRDLLYFMLLFFFASCNGEEESAQSKTLTLLTDNSMKSWSIYEYFIDEQPTSISPCDSSYVLSMKADFTWSETYTDFYCYQSTSGQWELNEDGDVITITYIDWSTGQETQRKFEITELTEENFTYQFAVRNVLKRLRMRVYD
jgi:hypothetical protein